jgi:hypothetical protein
MNNEESLDHASSQLRSRSRSRSRSPVAEKNAQVTTDDDVQGEKGMKDEFVVLKEDGEI